MSANVYIKSNGLRKKGNGLPQYLWARRGTGLNLSEKECVTPRRVPVNPYNIALCVHCSCNRRDAARADPYVRLSRTNGHEPSSQ
jgi:hypothetical protein